MADLSKPELMDGGKTIQRIGSRRQVKVYKTAKMTPGGLTAKDLVIKKNLKNFLMNVLIQLSR